MEGKKRKQKIIETKVEVKTKCWKEERDKENQGTI